MWMSHVAHVNESWHTYEWVTSHIWMSHDTHMNESWHTFNEWYHTCDWVTSHMHASRHTHEYVTWNTWMSHVTHMNESCHAYACFLNFHMFTGEQRFLDSSHATHMHALRHTYESSFHTYKRVTSHIWMRHVTHMNESCYTREWVTSQVCIYGEATVCRPDQLWGFFWKDRQVSFAKETWQWS